MFYKVRQVLPENFVQGYVGLVLEDYASIDHNIAHSQPANKKDKKLFKVGLLLLKSSFSL